MKKVLAIGIPVVTLLIFIGVIIWLWTGGGDATRLEKTRDITIVFLGLGYVLVTMLFAVFVGAFVWLVLMIKDKLLPTLDNLAQTTGTVKDSTSEIASRVKHTTDFVTEEVAAPLIKTVGIMTQARTWTKVVTRRPTPKPTSPVDLSTNLSRRVTTTSSCCPHLTRLNTSTLHLHRSYPLPPR